MASPRRKCVPVRDIIGNAEVRELCGGITRHTLLAWRKSSGFPKPIKTLKGARLTELWDARDVRDWLEARATPDRR